MDVENDNDSSVNENEKSISTSTSMDDNDNEEGKDMLEDTIENWNIRCQMSNNEYI